VTAAAVPRPSRYQQAALLAQRRAQLLARSQLQRDAIAQAWQGLAPSLHGVGLAWRIVGLAAGVVKRHRWLMVLPPLAIALLRRRWAGRCGWPLLTLWHRCCGRRC